MKAFSTTPTLATKAPAEDGTITSTSAKSPKGSGKRSRKPPKTHQTTPAAQKAATAKAASLASSPRATSTPLAFTEVTGFIPNRLTKVIGLKADGSMRKETAANLSCGKARRVEVNGLVALRDHLDTQTSANAVTWGTTRDVAVSICTNSDEAAKTQGAIARTRDNFHFANAPGVAMLDHDGLPDGALSPDQFRTRIIAAAPVLEGAPMLWRPSASAGCQHSDGRMLSPLVRHRLYIPVLDASLIPEAGKALTDLLWAKHGDGWFDIGVAGQALARCLVDTNVWQPERLDFTGPPVLEDGVTRPGCAGVIYGDEDAQFDLRLLIDSVTPALRKDAEANRKAAHAAIKVLCTERARAWAAEHAPVLAVRRGIKLSQAVTVLERASMHSVLMGDFDLKCFDGEVVSVAQLLDNPQRWNGARFADPLDPDHDQRVAVARLLNGSRPDIYSHRHGGMRYELRRQSARVQIGRGMRVDSTDAVLRVLRERTELFDYGDKAIAFVANGKATPVSKDWLVDHMGRVVEFYSIRTNRDEEGIKTSVQEVAEDAPTNVASAVMAKHGSRDFRKLTAVCTAPILRPDGSILDIPGHDIATGLLYITHEINPPSVPAAPNGDVALDALAFLWKPVSQFPLVDDVSTGVLLAGILTAAMRPSLPTAPAFGYDAPSAGTGKTLLAKCVGAVATGADTAVLPPAKEEEECRKRLFAALRGGDKALLWDNVRDPLGNAVIDAFLTSPTFADRVLGISETQELPNKALFQITGNNLVLTGDTHRRVLVARLDAQVERPFTREFNFDPLQVVIKNRQQLVVAALTIIRAYITAGRPKAALGRIASFEHWDDLVRQPLCWLKKIADDSGRTDLPVFADPAESITRSESENPEQAKLCAILNAWFKSFGSSATTVATITALDPLRDVLLRDAVDEIAGQNGKINSRVLGRWIERHAEQRIDGLRFVRAGKAHGVMRWQVLQTVERTNSRGKGGLGGLGWIPGPDIDATEGVTETAAE